MENLDPNLAIVGLFILALVAMVLGQLKTLGAFLRVLTRSASRGVEKPSPNSSAKNMQKANR